MSEAFRQNIESPTGIVGRVLARLRLLHSQSAGDQTDAERIAEGMSQLILGETTQNALLALIEKNTAVLTESAVSLGWDGEQLSSNISEMRQRVTAQIFREHWYESTLSDINHPIDSATYGTSTFRYDLRRDIANHLESEVAEKFAWIMFDANGLRSFKDCTSHTKTTLYLKAVARILLSKESQARQYLAENNISAIPMATGGDEFVLYLHGENVMTHEMIDEIVSLFQQEISESTELQAFLDFKSEVVRKKFGFSESDQRKAFEALDPEERENVLDMIGATLPDEFIPSFSGGGALLKDGILRAVERDDNDLKGEYETFQEMREVIVQATIDLAEREQKKNKEQGLRRLEREDPKTYEFRLRNSESRALQTEIKRLQGEIELLHSRFNQLFFPDLQDSGEPQQHQNSDDADDDVANPLELAVHWDVVEDQRDDEQNNEWSNGTHEEEGKEMRRMMRARKLLTLIRRMGALFLTKKS